MARSNVRLDYGELQKLKEQIMLFGDPTQTDMFLTSCAKELAARLLSKVIKRTPVGQYPEGSGKTGGTLRRGWTAGQNSNAQSFAKSMNVNKVGNDYVIEIINPVEYASYVEYGHRQQVGRYVPAIGKRLVQPYVPPKYFVKKTEEAFEPKINEYAKATLEKYLQGVLDGK